MKVRELSLFRERSEVSVASVEGAITVSTTSTSQSPGLQQSTTTVEADLLERSPPVSKRKRRAARASRKAVRLLIADDSAAVRQWLSSLFEAEGYEVVLACNGQEALELYQPGLIDVVLLDLDMPIKSGWDVFEEIAARNGSQAIILLTEQVRTVNLAGSGQAAGVAEKPLNPAALLEAVRAALRTPACNQQYTVDVQHSFARYTRPYNGAWSHVEAYEHWGLND